MAGNTWLKIVAAALLVCADAASAETNHRGTRGRYVHIDIPYTCEQLALSKVVVNEWSPYANENINAALNKPARMIAHLPGCGPQNAVNGKRNKPRTGEGMSITPERIANPWWEVDLGEEIEVERILANTFMGVKYNTFNRARVFLLDSNRRVVWYHGVYNATQWVNEFYLYPYMTETELLGTRIDRVEEPNIVSAPPQPTPKNRKADLANVLFNPTALRRAIDAYAEKHHELFKDSAELKSELAALEADVKAGRADQLAVSRFTEKIFFRIPEVAAIKDICFATRLDNFDRGMSPNWAGNSDR